MLVMHHTNSREKTENNLLLHEAKKEKGKRKTKKKKNLIFVRLMTYLVFNLPSSNKISINPFLRVHLDGIGMENGGRE